MDPVTAQFIAQGVATAAQAISRGGPRRQFKWNKRLAEEQNRMNRENAQWALDENKRIQQEQREYDSPEAQMARYKVAGLNPNLIYGSGGSAGTAFPISAQSPPGVNMGNVDASLPDIAGDWLRAGQSMASTALTRQRTELSQMDEALRSIQVDIAKNNPMLDASVVEYVTASMRETARLKMLEARMWMTNVPGTDGYMKISEKVNREVEALAQRVGLNTADLAIKNKILQSKEFENAIKEVQKNWLQDGDITPQHIYMGIMLLLQKMM